MKRLNWKVWLGCKLLGLNYDEYKEVCRRMESTDQMVKRGKVLTMVRTYGYVKGSELTMTERYAADEMALSGRLSKTMIGTETGYL